MMGNTPLSTPWSQSKYSPDGHLVNEPGGESWSSVNNGPSSRGESGLDAAPGLRTVRGSTAHCFDPANDPELVISGYSFIEPILHVRATRARLLRILCTRDSHCSERMGRGSARLLYNTNYKQAKPSCTDCCAKLYCMPYPGSWRIKYWIWGCHFASAHGPSHHHPSSVS